MKSKLENKYFPTENCEPETELVLIFSIGTFELYSDDLEIIITTIGYLKTFINI